MRSIFLSLLAALMLMLPIGMASATASTGGDADGGIVYFNGAIKLPNGKELPLSFEVSFGDGKATQILMNVPSQMLKGVKAANIEHKGASLKFAFPTFGARVEATLEDARSGLSGQFIQGASMALSMKAGPAPKAKIDATVVPGKAVDLSLAVPYGSPINGTLYKPSGDGSFPLVVLISGSGPQDRTAEVVPGFQIFTQYAAHLVQNGIAVFAFDDRAHDKGKAFANLTSLDHARDAAEALKQLKTRPDIDGNRTAYMGHSEGGMSEAIAHIRFEPASHLVNLAGSTVDIGAVILHQRALQNKVAGVPSSVNAAQVSLIGDLLDINRANPDPDTRTEKLKVHMQTLHMPDNIQRRLLAQFGSDWIHWGLIHDPVLDWSQVAVPVLALYGEKDLQVDGKQNIPPLEKALAANSDVTIRTLPGLNHLMQKAETGLGDEYASLPGKIDQSALMAISDWLRAQWRLS